MKLNNEPLCWVSHAVSVSSRGGHTALTSHHRLYGQMALENELSMVSSVTAFSSLHGSRLTPVKTNLAIK